MRIGEIVVDPRLHRLHDFGRHRRRRLVIEVDHAAFAWPWSRMRRHSAMKRTMSFSIVSGPKLTRITQAAISGAMFIAWSTRLAFMLPEEQALPAEIAMPARSKWTS